jgi:glucuronosyltransferase
LFDQDTNAKKVKNWGIGVSLNLFELSEKVLKEAIEEAIKPEYRKNIENLRYIVNDQPMSSREKAVWWIEYVLRHKTTEHLDYIGRHIPFYQQCFLDFIGLALIFCVAFIISFKFLIKFVKNEKIKKD